MHAGLGALLLTGDGSGWWNANSSRPRVARAIVIPIDELVLRDVPAPTSRLEPAPPPEQEPSREEKAEQTPELPALNEPSPADVNPLVKTVRPGIDDGNKDSPAWIGGKVATPHAGLRSKVDQAARTMHPGRPGPIGDGGLPQPELVEREQAPEAAAPEFEAELRETEPREAQRQESAQSDVRELAIETREGFDAAEELERAGESDEVFGIARAPRSLKERLDAQSPLRREPQKAVNERATPITLEQLVRALQRRHDVVPGEWTLEEAIKKQNAAPGGDMQQPGEASDSESIATTRQVTLTYKQGQPLAGEGLSIRTVQPKFGITTRLLRAAKNPTIDIVFDRTGKVVVAEFVKGESAGHPDIDEPILDAVYRWTASGKLLSGVSAAPGAGLHVRINFLLH